MWRVEHTSWHSPALGRRMDVRVHGHHGARVVVFPTSGGSVHEAEDFGLVGSVAEHVRRGWLQLFCVSSVDRESWYDRRRTIRQRAERQHAYDRYLLEELLPFTRHRNGNPFLVTAGCSFGGYHAMTFALRHPHVAGRVVAMSGLYDISWMTGGYSDDLVYGVNPCAFIPQEHDPGRLAALRRLDIVIAHGREDALVSHAERLSASLWERGIGNALRLWDGWAHNWPWWQRMFPMYVGGHD